MKRGRTIALFGDTGSGKTAQSGAVAKARFLADRQRTLYVSADRGGFDAIEPLEAVGVMQVVNLDEVDDPWVWINAATSGEMLQPDHGLIVIDSATSVSEFLLNQITKDPQQIGQQKTQRFKVGADKQLTVGANNESHYGLVQSFMLDQIWRSTWLTKRGVDVIWTFGLDRSEKADSSTVLGPKLAGHALTSQIPKWFNLTFMLVSVPVPGLPARHLLHLQEQPGMGGLGMSFGNPRYPLDAQTTLPAVIEPASVVEALQLIDQGKAEALEALRFETGL